MAFELDKGVDLSRAKKVMLGSHELNVVPLTLRKIIKAAGMLPELRQDASASDNLERLVDFAVLGLERTYPTLTREELLDSEATVAQLREICDVITEQAGGKKEAAPATAGSA
jgi:hypothetical protein